MPVKRYFVCGFVAIVVAGIATVSGQTTASAQLIYAVLQKPAAPRGYVGGSLKVGLESTSGFFVVTGESLRLGNADYKIAENAQSPKTYSLRDSGGRFLICCDNNAVSVSATPADAEKWFWIHFYTPAQKTEIENRRRAEQDRNSKPGRVIDIN